MTKYREYVEKMEQKKQNELGKGPDEDENIRDFIKALMYMSKEQRDNTLENEKKMNNLLDKYGIFDEEDRSL